jgi:hypothetical protein
VRETVSAEVGARAIWEKARVSLLLGLLGARKFSKAIRGMKNPSKPAAPRAPAKLTPEVEALLRLVARECLRQLAAAKPSEAPHCG